MSAFPAGVDVPTELAELLLGEDEKSKERRLNDLYRSATLV